MTETSQINSTTDTSTSNPTAVYWLDLVLTPGVGPLRGRKLAEQFGRVKNIFKAMLTELEAASIQTVSAQSLGIGRSLGLAHEEVTRAGVWRCHSRILGRWFLSKPA
jgi:predicted Rossmann fold nucleotide-binding protein DprA/Smf involved in DNA uptake